MPNDFVSQFMEYTKDSESPTSYFRWSAYFTLASVMRNQVYLYQNLKKIMPNMYVLLHGDSGKFRKGNPTGLSAELIRNLGNTKLITGRTSIQFVLQKMGNPETLETGKQIIGGSLAMVADELASFFVNDPACIPVLTDIYDYKPVADHNLKGEGTFLIKEQCVSFLMGSNETMLREVYTSIATHGGLLARTFFIKPVGIRPALAAFGRNEEEGEGIKSSSHLLEILKEKSKLKGEIKRTNEAKEEYERWYLSHYKRSQSSSDRTGVLARIHTGIIKLSMVLSLNYSDSLVIERSHVQEAIEECSEIIPNYEMYGISSGGAVIAKAGQMFLTALLSRESHRISHREFTSEYWMDIDVRVFSDLIDALKNNGMIEQEDDLSNLNKISSFYKLTDFGLKKLKEKMSK